MSTGEMPRLSVVLPVRNGEALLSSCLESLLMLDYPKDRLEIIVVDNASTDNTRDIIKKYSVRAAYEPRVGIAAARNRGIMEASGEFIASVDSDCVVDKSWARSIVSLFEEGVGGCGGRIATVRSGLALETYIDGKRGDIQSGCMRLEGERTFNDIGIPYIMGCNSCYRASALKEVGLYDERFVYLEDVDMSIKMALKGYSFKYASNALIYRREEDIILDALKKVFCYGFYRPLLFNKYDRILGRTSLGESVRGIGRLVTDVWYLVLGSIAVMVGKPIKVEFEFHYDLLFDLALIMGLSVGGLRFAAPFVKNEVIGTGSICFSCDDDFAMVIGGAKRKRPIILRGIAAKIWALISMGYPSGQIISMLSEEYDAAEDIIARDVDCLTAMFNKEGLVPRSILKDHYEL